MRVVWAFDRHQVFVPGRLLTNNRGFLHRLENWAEITTISIKHLCWIFIRDTIMPTEHYQVFTHDVHLGWLRATTSDAISCSRAHVRLDKEAVGAWLFIFIETSDIGCSSDWHHFFHLLFTKRRYDLVAVKGYCDVFQTKRSRCYIKHGVLPVEKLGQVKHWLCLFAQILLKVYLVLDLVLWDFGEIQAFIAFSQQLAFNNPWHLLIWR